MECVICELVPVSEILGKLKEEVETHVGLSLVKMSVPDLQPCEEAALADGTDLTSLSLVVLLVARLVCALCNGSA